MELPTRYEQAKNLMSTMMNAAERYIKTGKIVALESIIKQRIDTCLGCEFLDLENMKCSKCGCGYKAKATLEASECPLGKWNNNLTENNNGI